MNFRRLKAITSNIVPWILCIAFALWCTSPIWGSPHLMFMGRPATDNVVTPWFYDFVARSMWAGEDYTLLKDLDYPYPNQFRIEFPSATDAEIAAPIAWIFDWPQQWAVTLSTAVVFNCLAISFLALVIGLGPMGIAFSGMSAALMRPMWSDMVMGRMNVLTPGFAILALVGVILCFPKNWNNKKRGKSIRICGFVLAYSMGSLAALIYPPFLMMLVPVGLILVVSFLWNGGFFGWVMGYVAAWMSYLTVFDDIWSIYRNNYRVVDCTDLTCPDRYNSIALSDLMLFEPIPQQGLSLSGLQGGAWLLVPVVLLHPRLRFRGVLLGAVAILLAFLSMGPCPNETPFSRLRAEWLDIITPYVQPFWCFSIHLHDFGRFGLISATVLCLCGGIALDGLWRRRFIVPKILAIYLGYYVLQITYTPLMQEILHRSKWHAVPHNPIADFLEDKGRVSVAELPFDRSAQFLSVLQSPGPLRVNPLRPNDPPRSHTTFYLWLYSIGKGQKPTVSPTESEIRRAQLDWVLYDLARCGQYSPNQESCEPWILEELTNVLGEPQLLSFGVSAWKLR
jgi:hypothetical protein